MHAGRGGGATTVSTMFISPPSMLSTSLAAPTGQLSLELGGEGAGLCVLDGGLLELVRVLWYARASSRSCASRCAIIDNSARSISFSSCARRRVLRCRALTLHRDLLLSSLEFGLARLRGSSSALSCRP